MRPGWVRVRVGESQGSNCVFSQYRGEGRNSGPSCFPAPRFPAPPVSTMTRLPGFFPASILPARPPGPPGVPAWKSWRRRLAPAAALGFLLGASAETNVGAAATATDPAGNVVVTRYFSGNANFGPGGPRTSQGSGDAFVARYSPTGTLLWFRDLGGTQTDAGLGVASDAAGNVYVTGSFQGQATFGTGASATLTALGQTDAFALKLDSSGAFQWVHDFGGHWLPPATASPVSRGTST